MSAPAPASGLPALEVEGLCKRYPGFQLSDVSFRVGAGRIAGFVGRNGAGKTTTIKCLLGLVRPNGGTVRFFGVPLSGHEQEVKARIGSSTGAVDYYPRKRIGQILAVTRSFYPAWDDAACARYLARFGIDVAKEPRELSQGMRVKLNLVIALSHHARALILDEPTSGLDPFSRSELLQVLGALRDEGVALLYSTHIISDLERCADDIVYIRDGKVVAAADVGRFRANYGEPGESLEETLLRLEGASRGEDVSELVETGRRSA